MLYSNALPVSGVERILNATRCGDVFKKGDEADLASQYRHFMKITHPDVCNHPRANEAAAILNRLFERAKELVSRNTWEKSVSGFGKGSFSFIGEDADRLKQHIARAGIDTSEPDALQRYLETQEGADIYKLGKAAVENEIEYGAQTWYEWCPREWGTKWNSCDNTIDRDAGIITFSTAWSCPTPIVELLAQRFPEIDFKWEYADEDCGNNTGLHVHEEGELHSVLHDFQSAEAYQAYVNCWGASTCMYQDDDGNWQRYSFNCDDCPKADEC